MNLSADAGADLHNIFKLSPKNRVDRDGLWAILSFELMHKHY